MVQIELLKEIIVENEHFLLRGTGGIISREGMAFPAHLKKVCVLYGVRRSGKTYILLDIFKKNKERALYVDFEDERLEDFSGEDFQRLKESFFELKPHLIGRRDIVFLLDEVQNVKGWEKFCRRLVEKEGFQVFVTGSSSKMMPQEIHTSLRGRSWSREVTPFSFREYLKAKNLDIQARNVLYGDQKPLVRNYFLEYLKWGGFPEVLFLQSDYEKRKILKEYLEAMFFRDLVERFGMKNTPLLDTLEDKIFSSFAMRYSLTSFCKQYKDKFPFSKDSVFLYFRNFLESMLIFEVRKFSESTYQRLRNPPKIYPVDVGLTRKVASSDWGRLLECLVFLELHRRAEEIFYFEEKNECDFVVKNGRSFIIYQVTWELNEKNRLREINGLLEAAKFLKIKRGCILTHDQESQKKVHGLEVHIQPVWKWLLEKAD